ncbi:unnamed protein product [Danaus chrysippus]|uniref:(African queen) hypothetical protein n=1 Tax=Danaus chrysippus TaxID=151541 RepID=A0A8J2QJ98_9NEOP|nr:unnamed protein product [Danaus chrysippus]
MVTQTATSEKASAKYVFNRKAGRSIIEHRPIFSPDGQSIVVVVEDLARVYNIQTGDCVRTLQTEGSVGHLVGVQFTEDDGYNLYGCSEHGYVTTWTWEQGAVLREIKLSLPHNLKIISFNIVDNNECFIIAVRPDKSLHLGTYSVKDGILLYEYTGIECFYYGIISVALGWCNGDRYAAFTVGTRKLFIQNLSQPHLYSIISNHNRLRIMAVAAHQKDSTVAITDAIGRVTILRGNLYDSKSIAREVMHWHFLPPLAVCFSVQGNYLLTGGMEKVLVKWTLGSLATKTNEKSFIPRLPGIVRFITASSSHIAVTLSNNSIVIASPQLVVSRTILECGGTSPHVRFLASTLVWDRSRAALLLPGRTGHLQLYSTSSDTVLCNVDITQMNSLPAERLNLIPLETEVTCTAMSADGSWLVTSEYRNDGVLYPEEKLKFWASQQNTATPFKLNTCVNLSHGGCNVVALALNNKGEFCVSSGTDQKFRIWKRNTSSQDNRNKITWTCLTACYYSSGISHFLSNSVLNQYKGNKTPITDDSELPYMKKCCGTNDILTKIVNIHKENNLVLNNDEDRDDEFSMGSVAISQDGSLIAAWFGCKLTLWDTHLCNLRTTLSHPALRPRGVHVQFGNNDAAHYLVCTTEGCLAVWSLLSLTMKWIVPLNTTCLVADPCSNKMAVLTTNNDVFVFTPHSSVPILNLKNLIDYRSGVFRHCVFGACSGDDVRLYMMRNDSEIYCLEPEKSQEQLEVISQRNQPRSKFSVLVAEQQLYDVRAATTAGTEQLNREQLGNNAISQFLSGAPHMVPPVSLLCPLFLQHISGYEETEQIEEEVMEVDPQSSDDEDLPSKYTPKAIQMWAPNYEGVKEKRLMNILETPLLDDESIAIVFGE